MGRQSNDLAVDIYYLILVASAAFTGENVVEPLLPLQVVTMGASLLDAGAVVGVASIAAFLSRLPSGLLCRRIKFKTLISATLIGEGIAYFAYGLAPSYVWLLPSRVLWGVASAIFMVSMAATISSTSQSERIGWAMGTYLTSYGLGTVLGPLICSVLLSTLSYAQIIMLTSLLPVSGALVLNLRFGSSTLGNSRAGLAPFAESNRDNNDTSLKGAFSELLSIASKRRVMLAGALHFLFSVSITFLDTVFVVYVVTELHMDPSAATLLLAVRGIANTVVRSPAGTISDRFGQKIPFVVSFVALASSYILLAMTVNDWLMAFAMVVLGAAWGVSVVLEWTATQDEIPTVSRSIASSFLPLVYDVGHSAGAVAVGALALFVSVPIIFLVCAMLMLIATVIALVFWPSGRVQS